MSHLLRTNLSASLPLVVDGHGCTLRLSDGREVLDGAGSGGAACLGHGHERIAAALGRPAAQLVSSMTLGFGSAPAEMLAETLVGHAPGGLSHVVLTSSASESMEAAIKLARQYFLELNQPSRHRFVARRQSHHGDTLGALALGGELAGRMSYVPLLTDVVSHVSPAYEYRHRGTKETEADWVQRLVDELDAELQRLGPGTVAGFCAETVAGSGVGCAAAPAGYFSAIREVCDRYGILLILDETMCGLGRTGTLHAWEQEGVWPDIQVAAKGLAAGYQPIGAVLVSRRVMEALRSGSGLFQDGRAWQAHPMACAVALEVQRALAEDALLMNVRAMGERLRFRLEERLGRHPAVGQVRGRGLFWAVEFVEDGGSRRPFHPARKVAARVASAALAHGLTVQAGTGTADGTAGDHVLLAPPFVATWKEIDAMAARLGDAVDAALAA